MRRVGEIVRTPGGVLIARSRDENAPEIGTPVVDESLERVGRIVDVIGPVSRPYLVIDAEDDRAPATLLNAPVYTR